MISWGKNDYGEYRRPLREDPDQPPDYSNTDHGESCKGGGSSGGRAKSGKHPEDGFFDDHPEQDLAD